MKYNYMTEIRLKMYLKDCIYGHIEVPELCQAFIDQGEFQRLRRVRQLGMSSFAYPSATHTRFEHCLGVMYLAGQVVDQLRKYTEIPDRTKHLIQLAALYHDVGHFAYSHLFDSFLEHMEENSLLDIFRLKEHELRSIYFLEKVNKRLQLLTEEEGVFVTNVILGTPLEDDKIYLYQIVSNKRCGIDVDRMDYLRRDTYHTGIPSFQADYIIKSMVITENKEIGFKEKVRNEIVDLYATRQKMFNRVYLHHTVLKMDRLYYCMMKRLGPHLFTYGENTDDFNVETLLRNHPTTQEIMASIDKRDFTHTCEICSKYHQQEIKLRDQLSEVLFV